MSVSKKLSSSFSGGEKEYIVIGSTIYNWDSATGIGVSTDTISTGREVQATPERDAVIFYDGSSVSGAPFDATDGTIGTAYSSPGTLPNSPNQVLMSPLGNYVAYAHSGSPYVSVYPFDSATGFGSRLTGPSGMGGSFEQAYGVAISFTEGSVAVAGRNNPYFHAYAFSSSGFGTKYTSPSTAGVIRGNGVALSNGNTKAVNCTINAFPYLRQFNWTDGAGYGSSISSPTHAANTDHFRAEFSNDGNYLAVTLGSLPYLAVYEFSESTGIGTLLSNPSTAASPVNGSQQTISWSMSDDAIATGNSSGNVNIYEFSGSGLGARYSTILTSSYVTFI